MDFASMRPRHHTAENYRFVPHFGIERLASMRPRHHTAENAPYPVVPHPADRGFNEAAASHRGKLPLPKINIDGARKRRLRALVDNQTIQSDPLSVDTRFEHIFVDVKEQSYVRALHG